MTSSSSNLMLSGIGIGTRKIAGPLHFYRPRVTPLPTASHTADSRAQELRLQNALTQAREQIALLHRRALAEVGQTEAQIFEIHAMLLEDEDLTEAIAAALANGASAEQAVESAAKGVAADLEALGDPYLSGRAADVRDVAERILLNLSGSHGESATKAPDRPYILVARDLTPSQTMSLEKEKLLGFVTLEGTPNSHTSILARAMGIPALVGVGQLDEHYDGSFALLDAAHGTLTLSPDEGRRAEFQRLVEQENEIAREHDRYLRTLLNKPAVTRSGRRILIYANVGDEAEAESAMVNGADGIGLLRSEFLYLSLDRYPTEEELTAAYDAMVCKMQGKRIVIRTLDVGADKRIAYFDLPEEPNPALGFRAVRLCLAREGLFKTQLRAILRASAKGTISIMLPMIVSVEEVRRCRDLLEECKEELSREQIPFDSKIEFGIMVETPAAAIMSRELAEEVDFFSVGTNDLTQYTLAIDRQNPKVAPLGEKNGEAVLRLIELSAAAIHARGGWIGVCGEMAADLRLTQRLLDMGVDELSVSPPYLLGVREKVTECK
ncbi:MAG: phosphoenolpyruvate--protein phosphotransferase [Clostridia bacterium]|nr:phosphoenolpyruvate--protein phosphotransferase [Clostridia bacterium]